MIHPTAVIDPSAQLAADVEIGAYSIIGANVAMDEGCWVGPHAVVKGPSKFGKHNKIFQFSSLGDAPQDLKYAGGATYLNVGSNNVFREYCTINRGTEEGGGTTYIGDDNLFMAYTHVAHDCTVGNKTVFSNAASLAGHVEVGDQAILGGFTTVHQFTKIGEHSFTGLSTVVNRDIPPFVTAAGNHAKAYSINKEGLRRRGFSKATISALHAAFRTLVKGRGDREQALQELNDLCAEFPEVNRFVDFIRSSERGIIR